MGKTRRHAQGLLLRQFNEEFDQEHGKLSRGIENLWEKELLIQVGIRQDEIGKVFPRPHKDERKVAARRFRAACKTALRSGEDLFPLWREKFDHWFWD